jgi:hypothetical protein
MANVVPAAKIAVRPVVVAGPTGPTGPSSASFTARAMRSEPTNISMADLLVEIDRLTTRIAVLEAKVNG